MHGQGGAGGQHLGCIGTYIIHVILLYAYDRLRCSHRLATPNALTRLGFFLARLLPRFVEGLQLQLQVGTTFVVIIVWSLYCTVYAQYCPCLALKQRALHVICLALQYFLDLDYPPDAIDPEPRYWGPAQVAFAVGAALLRCGNGKSKKEGEEEGAREGKKAKVTLPR